MAIADARRYADGIVSWLVRSVDQPDGWAVFDRPAGSDRDLVVMAEAMGDHRLASPPPLRITHPADLAPLRHALAQIDGATLFDVDGTLTAMGVRLVPSPSAEQHVDGYRGMRHTSGRRYSYDDPTATVIVVSEDGPVTVLRNGDLLGVSRPSPDPDDAPDDR